LELESDESESGFGGGKRGLGDGVLIADGIGEGPNGGDSNL